MGKGKSLIVIGAGAAGLAAGVYAARSGYRTILVEQHAVPGGLCASWRRGGYLFDGRRDGVPFDGRCGIVNR